MQLACTYYLQPPLPCNRPQEEERQLQAILDRQAARAAEQGAAAGGGGSKASGDAAAQGAGPPADPKQ